MSTPQPPHSLHEAGADILEGAAFTDKTSVRFLLPGMRDWASTASPTSADGTADKQHDERLAAFLLTALQMHHLSVLAGSGTSFEVGGPAMSDLWAACVPTTPSPETSAVLRTLRYGEVDSERNIEELLSRCDAQLQVHPDDEAVAKFREQAVSTILSRCRDVGIDGVHNMGAHKEFLRRLARRRARDPRLKVFTTNYDLCFEQAAGDLGLVALDGFSFSQKRRFDPSFFDYDIVKRSTSTTDGPNYVSGVFQYFKLHGSVDWAFTGKGGVAIDRNVDAPRACLVYPTQQKYRFSFQQPHLELIAQFLSTLRQANSCLLTVGFGFKDDHLSEPIFSALESNPHLRVIVVSPRAELHLSTAASESWKRLRQLFEQGTDLAFIQGEFSKLVSIIPDLRALTPGERLERALFGATGGAVNAGLMQSLASGVLRPELFMGVVSSVSASQARMTLISGGAPSASHFESQRYGRGEVGEFVLIEGQLTLVLARLIEVSLPEADRKVFSLDYPAKQRYDVVGMLQFLGTVRCDTLRVAPGIANYPRIGDRVYAAPHDFVGQIPSLQEVKAASKSPITLNLGTVRGAGDAAVEVRPERLLGRHCAILGATGGGKSWTVARLLQEVTKHNAKVLLLDATSEYRTLPSGSTAHFHLGSPADAALDSQPCSLPAHDFQESDFIALFEPAGKVQGPKLREAIRSLRLVDIDPTLATAGILKKHGTVKAHIERAFKMHAKAVENPRSSFDVNFLAKQLMAECVYPDAGTLNNPDSKSWGNVNASDQTFCLPLAARIHAIVSSEAFSPVFGGVEQPFAKCFATFLSIDDCRIMRVCLGGVSYEYRAREFIVNAIGRAVLNEARKGTFRKQPLLVILDEAHNFLGRTLGYEDAKVHLDAFELIAREGRKYGLNICLATQRPRDLTEGVLSQIGTLIVHRLTNDRDREIVERACGEIDRSASAFLASLRSGEAAIIGVDFPIPLTVQIHRPSTPPASDGPDYQVAWQFAPKP